MFNYEKELEDYICNNQENFINSLKELFFTNEKIEFIGRQIKIGNNNIVDLLYYYDEKPKNPPYKDYFERNFIIIELKKGEINTTHINQIARYITTLADKLSYKVCEGMINVYGVLLGEKLNKDTEELSMFLRDYANDTIKFMEYNYDLKYNSIDLSYKDEYLNQLKLDDRLEKLIGD